MTNTTLADNILVDFGALREKLQSITDEVEKLRSTANAVTKDDLAAVMTSIDNLKSDLSASKDSWDKHFSRHISILSGGIIIATITVTAVGLILFAVGVHTLSDVNNNVSDMVNREIDKTISTDTKLLENLRAINDDITAQSKKYDAIDKKYEALLASYDIINSDEELGNALNDALSDAREARHPSVCEGNP